MLPPCALTAYLEVLWSGMSSADPGSVVALDAFVAETFDRLAQVGDEEHTLLSADTLPRPPNVLRTDAIVAVHGVSRIYHPRFITQGVDIYASRADFRRLGILAFSVLFHSEPHAVTLRLEAEPDVAGLGKERIENLVLRFEHLAGPGVNRLEQTPTAFDYWPTSRSRHPWCYDDAPVPADVYDYPYAYVSSQEDLGDPPLDHLFGFGSAEGTARFAALLLDIGHATSGTDGHELESEIGVRGVAPGSLEINLYPPGSTCFDVRQDMLGLPPC